MPHKDKKKHRHHSYRHRKSDRIDIDIDVVCEPCEPLISEQDANLVKTLYEVNRNTADLKTATALWGIVAHAKHRLRQQHEQLRKQQTSVMNNAPTKTSSNEECLSVDETLRVVRGLLQCNDDISGPNNKRVVVSAIFDILRFNPSIIKRYPKFGETVKSKCLDMIQQHHLVAAQLLYDQEWSKKEPRS
jgi:hypothetical protein